MQIIVFFKPEADVNRVAEYIHSLPKKADFEDVLDRIETGE